MPKFQFDPLPDEKQDELLETLQDIFDNGGKIPAEPGMALILAGVRKAYFAAISAKNTSRSNQIWLWILSAFVILTAAVLVNHVGPVAILSGPVP